MKQYSLQLVAPTTEPHVYEYIESVTIIPVTLLTLAALTPDRYDITIIDETVDPLTPRPCDIVAISVMYFTAEKAYRFADWYRARGIPVVMGGGHATLCPDEVREHCDALVVGEAEETWPELLSDFEKGCLKKEYREREKPDLAGLPPMPFHLIDKSRYDVKNIVQTSRGCSFGCDFCAIPPLNGRVSRHRPIPEVIEEIKQSLATSKGFADRTLLFSDDNIVNDPAYAKELFRALIPLNILWGSQCSLSIAYDDELLDLAARSGCQGLFIGFETTDQQALTGVHKRYDAASFAGHIRKIKSNGIIILGSFLFGLDEDSPDVFRKTVEFCMDNNIDLVNFHIVSPTPGTPFFERLDSEQRLLHHDWKYYQENVTYRPKGMSIRQLQDGQIWAYREYFRPRNIIRRVTHHWRSPFRFLAVVCTNLRFMRKMKQGIDHQIEFLKDYNSTHLGLTAQDD